MTMTFTVHELELVIEALEHRAGRHESMARFNPRAAGPHDRRARDMRRLVKLIRERDKEAA